MSPRLLPLAIAVMLSCSSAGVLAAPAALDSLTLLDQAGGLPDDFRDHFFDVPLVVRVERDGRFLGDARAVLSRDNTLSLLEFTDSHGSTETAAERERWLRVLAAPRPLGACVQACAGLVRLHYSLESSLLSIATSDAAGGRPTVRHHALPDGGSRGLILRHQLNAYAGQGTDPTGRYAVDLQGSLGHWTLAGSYQLDRSTDREGELRHSVQSLYAQRELRDAFLRAGYFLPSFQGVIRQPRAAGAANHTTVGVMVGSSDSLAIDSRAPSLYPVHVTANREGSVEVFRDGSLILTQPVQPGLQELDTRRLPGGIYEVELRVIEDGRESARETAVIHKPGNWRDPRRRWRYSAFAGVQQDLLQNSDAPGAGTFAAGGILNYLAHPRAVVGLSAQHLDDTHAVAGSVDWQVHDRANVYTNLYTGGQGRGADLQALWRYHHGTAILAHNRSWQERQRPWDRGFLAETRSGWLQTSALSVNHRVGDSSHVGGRVSHHRGVSRGLGLDLSVSRRQRLLGSDATWRASIFDRPANRSSGMRRNRGVDLTVNIALGAGGRRYTGSLGSRTATDGGRTLYASAGLQQRFDAGPLRSVGGQATADSDGLGLSATGLFEHPALHGDVHAQRASLGGQLSGGVNLESTLALGAGRWAVAGAGQAGSIDTGMIIDVRSALPDVALRAHDSRGGSYVLKPGRNVLPVTPYRIGAVQIDFDGRAAPAATIQPAVLDYHLNKGGVGYGAVEVLSTFTVMGHLRDADGTPLAGAHVINHAGRSVAEADGFFALEMSARAPSMDVRHPRVADCSFVLDGTTTRPRDGTWLAGILTCPPSSLTTTQPPSAAPAAGALP
ncbi:TcfC E-set like domain-containing protein [Stenotrophomonas sp. NPDC077464]|uniref:TcfC E-set like domain-containing protein n=1 Tax=unclassified Stenotrophomonas TaxID=196198 RepID=UPI0037D55FFC